MREVDSSHNAQLAALSEINHSLRQQVIELVLSIATMRENADSRPGTVSGAACGRPKMTRTFASAKSADFAKMRGQRRS